MAWIALLTLAACGRGTPAERLVGTWVFDRDAMLGQFEGRDESELSVQERQLLAVARAEELPRLVFTVDSVRFVFPGAARAERNEAGYRVLSEEADRLVLEMTSGPGEGDRTTVHLDGDRIRFQEGAGPFLPFMRD